MIFGREVPNIGKKLQEYNTINGGDKMSSERLPPNLFYFLSWYFFGGCKNDEFSQKSDGVPGQKVIEQGSYEATDMESRVADAFSGKIFVSVADPGETAVVVSMVEGKLLAGGSEDLTSKELDVDRDEKHMQSSYVDVDFAKTEMQLDENGSSSLICNHDGTVDSYTPNNLDNHERYFNISPGETSLKSHIKRRETSPLLSLSHDASLFSPGDSLALSYLKTDSVDEALFKPDAFNGSKLLLSISSDAHMNNCNACKNVSAKSQLETRIHRKKPKSEDNVNATLKCHVDSSISSGSKEISSPPALPEDKKLDSFCGKEAIASDIMSLVQEDCKSSKAAPHCSTECKLTREGDNVSGLRLKKIMRRVEDKESSMLLQKLRQEIRETVHSKSSMDFEKSDILDSKLLTAFRAAVVRPQNEQIYRINPSIIRSKKMMIQKGKIREKLTKKIYGNASGRRRHAWNRDWEIEFWKHRCMNTQPEKVQTLQSVLNLLNKCSDSSSEVSEQKEGPEVEGKNSILSRLYLADASVFPRKEDIEPLSVHAGSAALVKCDQESNLKKESPKANKSVHDNHKAKNSTSVSSTTSKGRIPSCNNTEKKGNILSCKGGAPCLKVQSKGPTRGESTSFSVSCGSKCHTDTAKENPGKANDVRSDKRKWALEVLARKTAKDAAHGKKEDNLDLKGNYPLLAQLSADMRPVLAPIRHNKVPMPVRQAQLYRLTEHFLRKTNLPVMRRTADTELAVADAVNIEKEICNRSNSKLVYVNLCSQVLLQRNNNTKVTTSETTASCTELGSPGTSEQQTKELTSNPAETTCEDAEAELKMAGLVSDSPPNSPYHPVKDPNDSVENVFDIDSHEDLDIYGDFEYDLGDSDCIDLSNMSNASKLQSKDKDSKMKVVLSTINCDKTQNALNFNDTKHPRNELAINNHEVGMIEVLADSLPLLKCSADGGIGSSDMEIKMDAPCLSLQAHHGGRDEEPSLAECEELYGPEKETLVDENYDNSASNPNKSWGMEATTEDVAVRNETDQSSKTTAVVSDFASGNCSENNVARTENPCDSSIEKDSPIPSENALRKDAKSNSDKDIYLSITKKVEAYVKEHIRPLCKSGVITAEQYRWAVAKTTEKVMKYHCKAKTASFLIKEGDKVKKLAEQYVEAARKN
ncbi:hypothetical protein ACLOJK_010255 [Asimina triloba]